jgi:hypothetical protein
MRERVWLVVPGRDLLVDPNPALTLGANSYVAFKAAKGEQRVFARGVSANHLNFLPAFLSAAHLVAPSTPALPCFRHPLAGTAC